MERRDFLANIIAALAAAINIPARLTASEPATIVKQQSSVTDTITLGGVGQRRVVLDVEWSKDGHINTPQTKTLIAETMRRGAMPGYLYKSVHIRVSPDGRALHYQATYTEVTHGTGQS